MITLKALDTLYAETDYGNVVYTLFGTSANGGDPRVLEQGFFAQVARIYYPQVGAVIHTAQFASVTPGATPTVRIYANGYSPSNLIYTAEIPEGGILAYGLFGWRVYTADGLPKVPAGGSSTLALNTYFP